MLDDFERRHMDQIKRITKAIDCDDDAALMRYNAVGLPLPLATVDPKAGR
jgi:hypothetical protein